MILNISDINRPFFNMISILIVSVYSGLPVNNTCRNASLIHDCGDYLICNPKGKCDYCQNDNQCMPRFYCKDSSRVGNKLCSYEPLTHKWDTRLIIGMICIFFAGVLVSGAGIGGGGMFVPVMMLIVDFPTSYAIPTSKALIFGGSLAVTLFNLRKVHPYYERPLINYNVAAIIEPISWLGTTLGVIINQVIPEWLLYSLQFLLLSYTSWGTFKKGLKDQRDAQKNKSTNDVLIKGTYEGKTYSVGLLWLLFFSWIVFLLVAFLRGGDGTGSIIGVKFCSNWFWVLTFGPFPLYLIITWFMVKVAKGYPVLGHKKDVSGTDISKLLFSGFIAGIAAGFLGIGGGMIKGPMMLALEIEAEEMAATSSLMILMTSSATSIQYIAMGVMPITEFVVFSSVGFVSFLIGINFLRWLVKKMGNRSMFLYALALLIFISAVLMSVVGVEIVIENIKYHVPMGFRPFCQ